MDLILTHQLGLTQAMQTSLHLLQMTNLELRDYIGDMMLKNPVVDLEFPEIDYRPGPFDRSYRASRVRGDTDDGEAVSKDQLMRDKASMPSELDDLFLQCAALALPEEQQKLLEFLIRSLDGSGFLKDTPESIAAVTQSDEELVQRTISLLRGMEPAGIGASTLQECLCIQLRRMYPEDTLALAIAESHLEQLAREEYSAIAKAQGVTRAQASAACERIRGLNPRPLNGGPSEEDTPFILPDFYVVEEQGQFRCILNDYYMPRITINPAYRELVRSRDISKEDSKYISDNYRQASEISNFLTYRKSTMQKVVEYIVSVQNDFFRLGPGHRTELSNRDVADALEMNESTISRTVNGKYFECKWGVFPMKTLFMHSMSNTSRNVTGSYDVILRKLQELVDSEKPGEAYSDQKLSELLSESGAPIARRTVAKYRQQLNIPSASMRKKAR